MPKVEFVTKTRPYQCDYDIEAADEELRAALADDPDPSDPESLFYQIWGPGFEALKPSEQLALLSKLHEKVEGSQAAALNPSVAKEPRTA